MIYPTCFARMTNHIALANCQIFVLIKKYGENVNIRIDFYFRAQMEYTRPDGGLKIHREALARYTE